MIGIEQLSGGVDHVLFVISLVLVIGAPWMLLKTITAFTRAHSITLALSTLDSVSLPQPPVEAAIALSIVFLTRVYAPTRSSPSSAFCRFGFRAGVLKAKLAFRKMVHSVAYCYSMSALKLGRLQLLVLSSLHCIHGARWLHASLMPLSCSTLAQSIQRGSVAIYWTIDRTLLLF